MGTLIMNEIAPAIQHQAPVRTGMVDISREILSKISEMPMGAGIECVLPEGCSGSSLRNSLAIASYGLPFSISMRFRSGRLFVYKLPHKQSQRSWRDEEVVDRRLSGETLESIAADLGVTRERVRQIEARAKYSTLPISERVAAVDSFIAPYLEMIPEKPTCVICCEALDKGSGLVCGTCRKTLRTIRVLVASRLRSYKATGKRYYLANAITAIKKHNLQPSDLKRG